MTMTYQWATGSRYDADPQVIGDRIEALRQANGGAVTPEQLVDDGYSESSPLHDCFLWNDEQAAEKYRVEQGRRILRSIVVFVDDRMPRPVRAFHAVYVAPEDRRRYVAVSEVLASAPLRRQLLEEALREIRIWRRRYAQYSELARIIEAVDVELELFEQPEESEVVFGPVTT